MDAGLHAEEQRAFIKEITVYVTDADGKQTPRTYLGADCLAGGIDRGHLCAAVKEGEDVRTFFDLPFTMVKGPPSPIVLASGPLKQPPNS